MSQWCDNIYIKDIAAVVIRHVFLQEIEITRKMYANGSNYCEELLVFDTIKKPMWFENNSDTLIHNILVNLKQKAHILHYLNSSKHIKEHKNMLYSMKCRTYLSW